MVPLVALALAVAGSGGGQVPAGAVRVPVGPAETPTPAALKGFLARVGSGAMRARTRIDGVMRFQVPVSGLDTSIRIAGSRYRVAYNSGYTKYITV